MLNVYANILPLNNIQRILASLQVFVELTKYVPREGIVARILSHAERRQARNTVSWPKLLGGKVSRRDSCPTRSRGKENHAILVPRGAAGRNCRTILVPRGAAGRKITRFLSHAEPRERIVARFLSHAELRKGIVARFLSLPNGGKLETTNNPAPRG